MALDLSGGMFQGILGGLAQAYHDQQVNLIQQDVDRRKSYGTFWQNIAEDNSGRWMPEQQQLAYQNMLGVLSTPITKKLPKQLDPGTAFEQFTQMRPGLPDLRSYYMAAMPSTATGQPQVQGAPPAAAPNAPPSAGPSLANGGFGPFLGAYGFGPGSTQTAAPAVTAAPTATGATPTGAAPAAGPPATTAPVPTPMPATPGIPQAQLPGTPVEGAPDIGSFLADLPPPPPRGNTALPTLEEQAWMGNFQNRLKMWMDATAKYAAARGETVGKFGDPRLLWNQSLPDIAKVLAKPEMTALPPGSGLQVMGGLNTLNALAQAYGLPGLPMAGPTQTVPAPTPSNAVAAPNAPPIPAGPKAGAGPVAAGPGAAQTGTAGVPVQLPDGSLYYPPGPVAKSEPLQAQDSVVAAALHNIGQDNLLRRIEADPEKGRLGYQQILDERIPGISPAERNTINEAIKEAKMTPEERLKYLAEKKALSPGEVTATARDIFNAPNLVAKIDNPDQEKLIRAEFHDKGLLWPRELPAPELEQEANAKATMIRLENVAKIMVEHPDVYGPVIGRLAKLASTTGVDLLSLLPSSLGSELFPGAQNADRAQAAQELATALAFMGGIEAKNALGTTRPAVQWMNILQEASANPNLSLKLMKGALAQQQEHANMAFKELYQLRYNRDAPQGVFGRERAGTNGRWWSETNWPGVEVGRRVPSEFVLPGVTPPAAPVGGERGAGAGAGTGGARGAVTPGTQGAPRAAATAPRPMPGAGGVGAAGIGVGAGQKGAPPPASVAARGRGTSLPPGIAMTPTGMTMTMDALEQAVASYNMIHPRNHIELEEMRRAVEAKNIRIVP